MHAGAQALNKVAPRVLPSPLLPALATPCTALLHALRCSLHSAAPCTALLPALHASMFVHCSTSPLLDPLHDQLKSKEAATAAFKMPIDAKPQIQIESRPLVWSYDAPFAFSSTLLDALLVCLGGYVGLCFLNALCLSYSAAQTRNDDRRPYIPHRGAFDTGCCSVFAIFGCEPPCTRSASQHALRKPFRKHPSPLHTASNPHPPPPANTSQTSRGQALFPRHRCHGRRRGCLRADRHRCRE